MDSLIIQCSIILKLFVMYKVLIESVLASDKKAITDIQQKLNTWQTIDKLVKYEMHTTSDMIVFNICLLK